MRRMRTALAVLGLGLARLGSAATARAQAAPEDSSSARVPLAANFSIAERVTIAAAAGAGIAAMLVAPRLVQVDAPSLGPPAPGSFDRRVSDALYDGGGGRFLGGLPDVAGLYVLPYLPALFYATEATVRARTGQPWFAGADVNADHLAWAYVEALGWTALVTGVTKVAVGRARPYVVLDHPELAESSHEANLSFFSSHASAVFCAAAFVALDTSDTLRRGRLARATPATRFFLGTLAPYAAAYGIAGLVGVSRVIDQQHWASDVLVGAGVGTVAAHLAYLAHFDGEGRPRRRLGTDALGAPGALALAPIPGGVALRGLLP
jgi:membrane-associated phospholipid phosphatase